MKQLIRGTAAYAVFKGDISAGRISHAYMLDFPDGDNLRSALEIFALAFFAADEQSITGKRIINKSYPDVIFAPEEGKKFNADGANAILAECALRPLEGDKKLIVISEFSDATPLVQNKLLKTLEEPNEGVYFLLGTTTTAPVLDTIKSRVKTLTISPFSESEIFEALERKGDNPLNRAAAQSCGGILGDAERMVSGGWFDEVRSAAREICTTVDIGQIGEVALKYGDSKYKNEIIRAVAFNFHNALKSKIRGEENDVAELFETPALIFAGECADRACRDMKFNAFFQGLLYDMLLRITEENEKWSKLRE